MSPSGFMPRHHWSIFLLLGMGVSLALGWWLRQLPFVADPALYGHLETIGSLMAFTYAANLLVRFRGTQDRVSLILAVAFVVAGLIEIVSGLTFHQTLWFAKGVPAEVPLPWMIGRTLLGILLVAAAVVERCLPASPSPSREITSVFVVVAAAAYLTSAAFIGAMSEPVIRADAWLPRPWQMLPAAFFLVAAIEFGRLRSNAESYGDRAIFWAAALNVLCHVIASQAGSLLSAPFAAAQILKVGSYAVLLGGALLDNARLFDQVRQLAVNDPLTGLANYRRFVDTLEAEIQRSDRTQRPFSLVLLDLDGLKKINDRLGHAAGTRAICRVAEVLRLHCRSMDTAARYGGDEFALVLPETGSQAAELVAERIEARLEADPEPPAIHASIGVAVFPRDGVTVDALINSADRGLYRMKGRHRRNRKLQEVAACF